MNTATATNLPAKAEVSANPTVRVQAMVQKFMNAGTLHLPSGYSAENALKSAWLILQNVENLDKKKVIVNGKINTEVVTEASVVNCLLDMVVQGLNPMKKQCYFIVYGKLLTMQRSYFGDEVVARRVDPDCSLYYGVVYEKDTFEIGIVRGRRVILSHKTALENIDGKKIKAAYCGLFNESTGEDAGAEIMTFEQIRTSWAKSKTYKDETTKSFHNEQPDQACLRTVIRRRCKPVINSSTDDLLLESIRRQDLDAAEGELESEMIEQANGEIIDVSSAIEANNHAAETEFDPLDEPALKKCLKLNGDQWDHITDQLATKDYEGSVVDFLNACLRNGCTDYKSVSAKLQDLPDSGAETKDGLPF